ncbi:MAG: hypothetical protein IJ157_10740 [Clostridia bacterium]|nr:hypothetical protein [Clostridia bacterium]
MNNALKKAKNMLRWITALFRHADYVPLLLLWTAALSYCLLCPMIGRTVTGISGYFTYTLQALAWRDGHAYLDMNYDWLELAFYQGHWYVSFPPVPSIPLFLLTFLFQNNTPDNLLVKLYVYFGCIALYRLFLRAGYKKHHAISFAVLCSYASCLLTLTNEGAVWYQAQTLAFCLTCAALALMYAGKPMVSLLCYALAVGCRPFNALYGFLLFAVFADQCRKTGLNFKKSIYRLLPGLIAGLLIAFAYGVYNYIRFDHPLEFGHNYLPEFSWQGGTQFSLEHIAENVRVFVFGLPFVETMNGWKLYQFGFSFLIANPVFALTLCWIARDIAKRSFSWVKAVLILCFCTQLFLLLLHRTFGGYQFGARYTCDLLPYAAFYLALPGHSRRMRIPEVMVTIAALVFSIYGFIATPL